MEKLINLFKNKRFLAIFSGFLLLTGLILIIRKKPENNDKINDKDDFKNELKNEIKSIKGLIKKNKELEEKANGKSITKSNSAGKPKPTKSDDNGEKGKRQTTEIDDGTDDESDDEPEISAE